MEPSINVKSSTCILAVLFAAQGCAGFTSQTASECPSLNPVRVSGAPTANGIIPTRCNKGALVGPLNALPVLEAIGNFYESSPYEAAFLTCAFKASAADIVAQIRQNANTSPERSSDYRGLPPSDDSNVGTSIEFQRTLSFLLYGGLYQGCTQLYIYNHLFPVWFGNGADPQVVAAKVLSDMVILAPLLPLPFSYSIKAIIYGKPITEGLKKYVDDVKNEGLLLKYWSFWSPVQSISFSIVPDYLRIPFMATFSFVWLIVLSTIANRAPEAITEAKERNLLDAYRGQIRERLKGIAVTEHEVEEKKQVYAF